MKKVFLFTAVLFVAPCIYRTLDKCIGKSMKSKGKKIIRRLQEKRLNESAFFLFSHFVSRPVVVFLFAYAISMKSRIFCFISFS